MDMKKKIVHAFLSSENIIVCTMEALIINVRYTITKKIKIKSEKENLRHKILFWFILKLELRLAKESIIISTLHLFVISLNYKKKRI